MAQYQSYITSSALKSIHPNQDVFPFTSSFFSSSLLSGSVAVGVGFGTSSNFRGEVLNRVIPSFFTSPTSPSTDRIRIIEQETTGNVLSPYLRTEKTNPIDLKSDTNQLNIVFSQTNQINKDILGQIGPYFTLDEYAGSVALQYEPNYIFLDDLKTHYLSKYRGKNNINAFIRLVENFDSSILETTEKVIPGRTNATIGTSIESHILDRSKVQRFEPTFTNNTYEDGGLDARAQFAEFAISGDVFSGGKIAGTLYTSVEADKIYDGKNTSLNSININDQNLELFAPSDTGYVDLEGNRANYDPGLTLSVRSTYLKSPTDPNNSNVLPYTPTSTLVYVFDSLVPYKIPTVNLLNNNSISSSDNYVESAGQPIYALENSNFTKNDPIVFNKDDAYSFEFYANGGFNGGIGDNTGVGYLKAIFSEKFAIISGSTININGSIFFSDFAVPNVNIFSLTTGSAITASNSVLTNNAPQIAISIKSGSSYPLYNTNGSTSTFLSASQIIPSTAREYFAVNSNMNLFSTGIISSSVNVANTINFNITGSVSQTYTNCFLEILVSFPRIAVYKDVYEYLDSNRYNYNATNKEFIAPLGLYLNNFKLIINETEKEEYAFRIKKLINIDSENIEGSEIISSEDVSFTNIMDNEVIPNFNFSITNFGDTPNRLKPSYNVFTSSLGLVERGNLIGRNYIPIKLTFGDLETDDLPTYYNFDEKGIIFPTNISTNFESAKQDIINFIKDDIENLR